MTRAARIRILKAAHRGAVDDVRGRRPQRRRRPARGRRRTSRTSSSHLPPRAILDEHDAQGRARDARRGARRAGRRGPLRAPPRRDAASPLLIELPPLVACEIQLRLLVRLGVASEVSLWRARRGHRSTPVALARRRRREPSRPGDREGGPAARRHAEPARRTHAPIRARPTLPDAVRGDRRPRRRARRARRRLPRDDRRRRCRAIYERELLLERSAERERVLVRAGEQRLMRIGFDLHDGPIQDVLSLGAEVTLLRDQVYPFIADTHRERAAGRFDDILARVTELDRQLRELSRSLESRSIITRPLGEILHREVDAFVERTGIETRLEIRGDPESLTSAQRIAVYRAIQESLSNVREHSGAATVEIRLRMRRASIEVRSRTTATASTSAGRSRARRSAAGSASSGSASASGCSAARSRSTAPRRPDDAHLRPPARLARTSGRRSVRWCRPARQDEGEGSAAGSPPQLSALPGPHSGVSSSLVGPLQPFGALALSIAGRRVSRAPPLSGESRRAARRR